MRMSSVLVLIALAAAGVLAYILLRPDEAPTIPEPVQDSTGSEATKPPEERPVRTATRGTLIIRVRTPDAMPLPPGTKAGYIEGLERRLRSAALDGTFRFSDAPLGKLDVVAEAEGYRPGTSVVVVTPQIPTEVVVTLELKD